MELVEQSCSESGWKTHVIFGVPENSSVLQMQQWESWESQQLAAQGKEQQPGNPRTSQGLLTFIQCCDGGGLLVGQVGKTRPSDRALCSDLLLEKHSSLISVGLILFRRIC